MKLCNIKKVLSKAIEKQQLLRIFRGKLDDGFWTDGYVLKKSDDYILVHFVDDRIVLDGYLVLRIKDIKKIKRKQGKLKFIEKALLARGLVPKCPSYVDLSSMRSVVQSVGENSSLLAFQCERINNEICSIGKVIDVSNKRVKFKYIDCSAQWGDIEQIFLSDITWVSWEGSYIKALETVNSQYERENSK